jgi:hypothetical protein
VGGRAQLRSVGLDVRFWLERAFQADLESALHAQTKRLVSRFAAMIAADRWLLQARPLNTGACTG